MTRIRHDTTPCLDCGKAAQGSRCHTCFRRRQAATDPEAFWANVDMSGGSESCWHWLRGRSGGYGKTTWRGPTRAHRVALELSLGRSITPGLLACHTCDNPPCCNPAHLFEGTHAANNADAARKGRVHERVSAEQVITIRRRKAAGEAVRVLALEFGVSQSAIRQYASGHRRPHVPMERVA